MISRQEGDHGEQRSGGSPDLWEIKEIREINQTGCPARARYIRMGSLMFCLALCSYFAIVQTQLLN